ncbi:hypothetical protein [Candidatus Nitrosotenuis cloacae]|uniref:hypothetical protein n=1 Tax=Candidatus Nitrosotenuis cloacae TaxID=1603555 RepID=UPI00227DD54C|nr:hypothetical protein [Candidatus Nitrosotenuis cloacae]
MEIALVISSIAGAATAATINKFPKNKNKMPLLGATSHIRAQIDSLKIEKDILAKTISRLYQDSSDLSRIQRDKLLSKYQHQLGVVLAKIEKMEEASKYPDLGPLGDGLMSLMDQKLSALDKRLAEISSKISVASVQMEKPEAKKEVPKVEAKPERPIEKQEIASSQSIEEMIQSFAKPAKRFEITTLTEIPSVPQHIPPIEIPAPQVQIQPETRQEVVQSQIVAATAKEIIQQVQETVQPQTIQKSFITEPIDIEQKIRSEPPKLEFREESKAEERRKTKINIPEPEEIEEDEDDLDSIKREIMKTLSKLEQAEVE